MAREFGKRQGESDVLALIVLASYGVWLAIVGYQSLMAVNIVFAIVPALCVLLCIAAIRYRFLEVPAVFFSGLLHYASLAILFIFAMFSAHFFAWLLYALASTIVVRACIARILHSRVA